MVKEVIRTETFIRRLSKLDKFYIERIEKIIIKIIQNPEIGKPMRNIRKGTREVYSSCKCSICKALRRRDVNRYYE